MGLMLWAKARSFLNSHDVWILKMHLVPLVTPRQATGMQFFRRRYNLKRTGRFGIRRLRKRSPGLENIFDISSGCIKYWKKQTKYISYLHFPCMIDWLKSSFMDCHFKRNIFTHEKFQVIFSGMFIPVLYL